jgi:hypothetical protein
MGGPCGNELEQFWLKAAERGTISSHRDAISERVCQHSSAHAGNRLDVSAYRCVDVAGRNRQNCSASIVPVMAGCHPARAFNNARVSIRFPISRKEPFTKEEGIPIGERNFPPIKKDERYSIRASRFLTDDRCQLLPRAGRIPRALRALAISLRVAAPAF